MAKDKSASPTWADVKAFLLTFDRAGLQGLVQDLYAASKDNQAFLHARFGLGPDELGPYKATISRSINPDLMKNERYFVALIRMYDRSVNRVLSLPLAGRRAYVERLSKLRIRAKHLSWGVEDELNDLWHAADFDEQLE